jgi:hypothetical protein
MKRNKILKLIPFVGLVFLSLTCEKEEDAVTPKASGQEVFFEVTYINFAWGEQASVFYVKSDGTVKYQKGKPIHFSENSKGQLTESELKENLALATINKKQIPTAELNKYSAMINDLKSVSFSKKIQAGADMGAYTYTAYQFSETEKVYRAIKLAEEGDWTSYNLDPNAKVITEWLKSLQTEVYSK